MNQKQQLLANWGKAIAEAAQKGAFSSGRPVAISKLQAIAGPRAGALMIRAGLDVGRLLRVLSQNDCATLRQFIPWQFAGDPQAFMDGRYLRIEAGWPTGLADNVIRLGDIQNRPDGNGRWVAGVNEHGATVLPSLSDKTPHFLVSGATGSGKSVALQCAILQLAQDDNNSIVLVDGKMGESLKPLERLPGIVGPCATDGPQARNALGWAVTEMRQRYTSGNKSGRVIVVVDEFQELVEDIIVVDLLRKLVAQGRAANVHAMLATQHPTVDAFKDPSIRRNLVGKVALHVGDADASRVAVGGRTPRADKLLGAGDSYTIAPGQCHRVQLAFVDELEITSAEGPGHAWRYSRWPDYDAADVGQDLPRRGQFQFTGDELGIAIESAVECEGRDMFTRRMANAEFGRPGYNRQLRLRQLGQGALDQMQSDGYAVCKRTAIPEGWDTAVTVW